MDGSEAGVNTGFLENTQRSSVSSMSSRSVDVLVYLINDTVVPLAVDGLASMAAYELHRIIRDALQLQEIAQDAFSLWLVSPLLEVQLKPKHQPYKICRQWQDLLFRFSEASEEDITQDEPSLQFRRNVFFPKKRELLIDDELTLRLLYEEAKYNVLEGRYPCDLEDCDKLGGLACRVELGPFDQGQHTASSLREKLDLFLPNYICKRRAGGFLSSFRHRGNKQANHEHRLLSTYKQVRDDSACETSEVLKKHYRDYLQKCHELPYYGCAFFMGSVDKPAQGFLQRTGRRPVSVAINLQGVYVIDCKEKHVLLGLQYQELSWDHTYPDEEDHILWLEFDGDNEGTPVNKLLKVYSKQAALMSGLIEFCIELNLAVEAATLETANSSLVPQTPRSRLAEKRTKLQRQISVVCNRLQHLTTIDYVEDGTEIKRVKPKRTTSFFSRPASHGATSYSEVQTSENLEQG